MNQITDHDWEYKGLDGCVKNDWYVVPFVILGAIVVGIMFYGADRFIEDVSNLIVSI